MIKSKVTMPEGVITGNDIIDSTLSELLKIGATFNYCDSTEDDIKCGILPLIVTLPGAIHEVDIEMKFEDE